MTAVTLVQPWPVAAVQRSNKDQTVTLAEVRGLKMPLLAVIGSGVLAGATVLRGALVSAFDRLVTLVNGIG